MSLLRSYEVENITLFSLFSSFIPDILRRKNSKITKTALAFFRMRVYFFTKSIPIIAKWSSK